MVQLKQLAYYVAVVDAGSISRASAAIRVAQPALSLQMGQIERLYGQRLLVRGPRGVTPTAAGEALYRHARSILGQVQALPALLAGEGGCRADEPARTAMAHAASAAGRV